MNTRIFALLTLFLGGCAVGPQYQRESPTVPDAFATVEAEAVQALAGPAGPLPDERWWSGLQDQVLDGLIEQAVESNLDLAVAKARVLEARAGRSGARSRYAPQVDSRSSAQRFSASENGLSTPQDLVNAEVIDLDDDLFEVGFDAAWELDFFGSVSRGVESADARADRAVESERAVLVSVIAEVARNYVELRGTQRRLAIAEKNIRIQTDTLKLVQNRYNTGLASDIDVARASAQLDTTRSVVPPLRSAIRATAHRLAVLTGQYPDRLLAELLNTAPIPSPPDLVPVGLPADLVWRRADVRAAERSLAAATADIGVATADLYPKFFITGTAGVENRDFSDLFNSSSRTWALGPLIEWPIFRGGALRANVRASEARRDIAYAEFQQAILLALEDVETHLARYAEEQIRRDSLDAATESSKRTVVLAQVLYDKGLDDFLTVLDAERTLTQVEDQLVVSETKVVLQLIALYKALGGGWEVFLPEDVAQN